MGERIQRKHTKVADSPVKLRTVSAFKRRMKEGWQTTKNVGMFAVKHPILTAALLTTAAGSVSLTNAQTKADSLFAKGQFNHGTVAPPSAFPKEKINNFKPTLEKPYWNFKYEPGTRTCIPSSGSGEVNIIGMNVFSILGADEFDGNETERTIKSVTGGWLHIVTNPKWTGILILEERLIQRDGKTIVILDETGTGKIGGPKIIYPIIEYSDGVGGWLAATEMGMIGTVGGELWDLFLTKKFGVDRIENPKFTEVPTADGGKTVTFSAKNSTGRFTIYYGGDKKPYSTEINDGIQIVSR